jgi:hypothetical protein
MRSCAALPRTRECVLTGVLTGRPWLDQLAVRDRDHERACEEDEDEREQKQAQAVVLAGEVRIHGSCLAEHHRVDGEGDEEEREVGQGVREEPARAGRRGLAEELDRQEQEEPT